MLCSDGTKAEPFDPEVKHYKVEKSNSSQLDHTTFSVKNGVDSRKMVKVDKTMDGALYRENLEVNRLKAVKDLSLGKVFAI